MHDELYDLTKAYAALERSAPHLLAPLQTEIINRLDGLTFDTPQDALDTLLYLPAPILHLLLETHPAAATGFLTQALPPLATKTIYTSPLKALPLATLLLLKTHGLRYEDLENAPWTDLWLSKGAAFGEAGWRRKHPRKNPVLARWENGAITLPVTLCPEGAALVADTIRNTSQTLPMTMQRGLHKSVDWRVLYCFLSKGVDTPKEMCTHYLWNLSLRDKTLQAFQLLFGNTNSAHEQVQRAQYRLRMRPMEDILLMGAHDSPSVEALLYPCPTPETVAA